MDKVYKMDTPLLIAGMGGAGLDAVLRIKRDFADNFISNNGRPNRTEYCVIDTGDSACNTEKFGTLLEKDEYIGLKCGSRDQLRKAADDPCVRPWLDGELIERLWQYDTSEVSCRQLTRMLLFMNIDEVVAVLTHKLITLARGGFLTDRIEVKLISSLGGYTGSALLLDIAYILRQLMRTTPELQGIGVDIEVFALLPDRTCAYDHSFAAVANMNAYAALKEIDRFMSAETSGECMTVRYNGRIAADWKGKPFDSIKLIGRPQEADESASVIFRKLNSMISNYLVACYTDCSFMGTGYSNYRTASEMLAKGYGNMPVELNDGRFYGAIGESDSRQVTEYLSECMRVKVSDFVSGSMTEKARDIDLQVVENFTVAFTKGAWEIGSGTLFAAYASRHPIPNMLFGGEPPYSCEDARRWKDASGTLHGDAYAQFTDMLDLAHEQETKMLEAGAWALFLKEAEKIGTDPARGPEYLRGMLLSIPEGILYELDNCLHKTDGILHTLLYDQHNLFNEKGGLLHGCYSEFRRFADRIASRLLNLDRNRFMAYVCACEKL